MPVPLDHQLSSVDGDVAELDGADDGQAGADEIACVRRPTAALAPGRRLSLR
jgi:hypothetical protein